MRDIFLVAVVIAGLGVTVRFPFVGVLIWEWFSLMQPHQEAFGFSRSLPLNLCIAVVTILSWLFSKEPKRLPAHPIIVLLGIFLLWTTFNSFFAFDPDWSWQYWDRTWRIFLLGFVIATLATNRIRIESIIWVAVLSLLYYGIKGGVFTIMAGGVYKVYGPENSIIYDNNQLALALLIVMPLMEYLRGATESKLLSGFLLGAMALTGIAILGSYSRGAYIAMAAIALFALLRARRKLLFIAVTAIVLIPALYFMPQSFYDRVNTIGDASSDASMHGRIVAWEVALRYATEHFPFGAGFYGPQLGAIFNSYFPDETAHAAHSIYFQTLGEHGFIGLIIYLLLALVSLVVCSRIAKRSSRSGALWGQRLAFMLQISLIAFFVGGALLSMAYYDLYIILICLLPNLMRQVSPEGAGVKMFRAGIARFARDGPDGKEAQQVAPISVRYAETGINL